MSQNKKMLDYLTLKLPQTTSYIVSEYVSWTVGKHDCAPASYVYYEHVSNEITQVKQNTVIA